MWARALLLGFVALGLASCGGNETSEPGSPKPQPPLRLAAGAVPGTPVPGRFNDERARIVTDVHRLAAAGRGAARTQLLVGRSRSGAPCVGLRTTAHESTLHCFEPWERPHIVVRVAAGGSNRGSTDWLVVAGIVAGEVDSVEVETEHWRRLRPRLRSFRDFPWRAYAVLTRGRDLGVRLVASADAERIASVDLALAYGTPCEDPTRGCPGQADPWVLALDPVTAASGAADRRSLEEIAFRDPDVRRLIAGSSFTVADVSGWSSCQGHRIGGVLSLWFHPPIDFTGELPVRADWDRSGSAAYRSGRVFFNANRIRAADVWVDIVSGRVAGVELDTPLLYDEDIPPPRVHRSDVVDEPVPYLTDDPAACPPDSD
jgi:hypothetical protein